MLMQNQTSMFFHYYLFLISVFALSCGSVPIKEPETQLTTRRELIQAFRNADTIAIIYSINDAASSTLINAIKNQSDAATNERTVLIIEESEADLNVLSGFPLYIIGSLQHNSLFSKLKNQLPYQVTVKGFKFNNIEYAGTSDILKIAFYPNPINPTSPLTIILGNSDVEVASYLQEAMQESYGYFFWDSWGYQVISNKSRMVIGYFSEDSLSMWTLDKKKHWEFNYAGTPIHSNKYFDFYDHNSQISKKQLDSISAYTIRNFSALEKFTGATLPVKFKYHIYSSTEMKGLMINNTDQSNVQFKTGDVHAVYESEFHENYAGKELLLAVRQLLGETEIMALENGVATMFNSKWCEHGYKFWAMKLYRSGNMPTLSELTNNILFEQSSPYIYNTTAALLIEFLTSQYGDEKFMRSYSNFHGQDLLSLNKKWISYVEKESEKYPSTKETIGYNADSFLKGFNFAHEGYQIYNGYLGSAAADALRKAAAIGSNAISIIPYGFLSELDKPVRYHFANGPGAENDESIIRSAFVANQLEMSTMLKPQLWTWKGWTGDLSMQNESDWKQFFKYYYDWIIHYAFMAELYHFDFFCIGVEFQKATLSHEEEWVALFEKVRKLYSGKITYAANWGDEFEKVKFWNHLDYISINCYYPLSDKTNVSDEELLDSFEKTLDKIESVQKKFNKPLIITEIGFKSIDFPWIQPHKDADEQNYNEVSQQRCYEIMFKAMTDEPWINGVYLWQWPSYLDYVESNPKGFTPAGKLAEATVKKWFQKM